MINPDYEDTKRIQEWNEKADKSELKTLSMKTQRGGAAPAERVSVEDIETRGMEASESVVLDTRATVVYVK